MDETIHTCKSEEREINNIKMYNNVPDNTRKVVVGNQRPPHRFCSNKVVTARYTWLTWGPKSLLMQFTRINNVYFLIMSILSIFPFSPKNPYTLGATFAAVLIFTMFKEGYEDIARHRQDTEVNKKIVKKYSETNHSFVDLESQHIKVGDLVKISENETFPADLVMIANSHPKGIAFVNTMNLDGETNLKDKLVYHATKDIKNDSDLKHFEAEFYVDLPSISLVSWNCNIRIKELYEPLGMKQLLLRGCVLKNTDWLIGAVVYTGLDSKIVLNSKKAPTKFSNIQRTMNWILMTVFIMQISVCFIFAGIGQSWLEKHTDANYINLPDVNATTFILRVLTYWVGYSHLIPISLYVALELVRLFLARFIKNDTNMYYEPMDRSALCRASDLIEELGEVEFIFSDKTGTLTCNEMEFRKCSINEKIFGKTTGKISNDENMRLAINDKSHDDHGAVNEYLLLLALCHSVFPARHNYGELVYQASSPDELALVEAAKSLGYELKERSEGKLRIEVQGSEQIWEILVEIPFNSDRKRMSIVTRHPVSHKLILMTKGADTMMMPLISYKNIKEVQKELDSFAVEGLRTLVMGSKVLKEDEFSTWYNDWKNLQLSNSKNKEAELDEQGAKLEFDLEFIGTSAIEDKLQNGVPETIKLLMDADIRIWVLTGDKEETAIEIAKSCNLIRENMETITLFLHSSVEVKTKLKEIFLTYSINSSADFEELEENMAQLSKPLAIVVNGITLSYILSDAEMSEMFFKLGFISNSCVCCRVSPAQKMLVVRLCKNYGKWISLAIGDGANDVSMIQEAHIGVGIAGKEGTQAVQAAEFTFAQFKHLERLLLVHGRYAYNRISLFILYYFYKNFLSVFTELWFALFNGFSGQIYFLDWLPSLYNTFWTSWPCITFFTLEQDVSPERSLEFPNLYSAGQKSALFNVKIFWRWIFFAFLSAVWTFWLPVMSLNKGMGKEGHEPALFWISTVSFIMLIHIVNLKLLLTSYFWCKPSL